MSENGRRHRPRKRFGQNFLHDKNIIRKIVESIDAEPENAIVEIGPGKGALTAELLSRFSMVHAIEIDRDLVLALQNSFADSERLRLYQADALEFDFSDIQPQPLHIVGNLPYNISTPLLFYLLQNISLTRNMIFMLQDEVVERICANVDTASYGRLSVMIQSCCEVEKLFQVPASAFTPSPKVTSAVVQIQPQAELAERILNPASFEALVRQAFSQRRKTIRKALSKTVGPDLFQQVGLDSGMRAGELGVEDYISLSNGLQKIRAPHS